MSDTPEGQHPADIVAYRLSEIEKRLDAQAKEQARGFSEVARQIAGLTFVRLDVYDADQRHANEVHATLRKDVEELRSKCTKDFDEVRADMAKEKLRVDARINWSHAVIGVALLGGVIASIARLAGLS